MTVVNLEHLAPKIRPAVQLPPGERMVGLMEDRWIGYTAAATILVRLNDAITLPNSRRSNLLIVGYPSNGKTSLLAHFAAMHPVSIPHPSTGEEPCVPVVMINMPPKADEGRFWSTLLNQLSIPHRDRESPASKENKAISVLRANHTKILVLDEFHNILHGNPRDIRQLLSSLRNLINQLGIPIIAAGTREALLALNHDPQMTSRFEVLSLPRWNLDPEFLRLLASFERVLPLAEPSMLTEREKATAIYANCGGTIGGAADLLQRAAKIALRSGKESITLAMIQQAKTTSVDQFARELRDGTT